MKKINKIYFFPHAGASANCFFPYKEKLLAKGFDCILIDYSGHGSFFSEPFASSIEEEAKKIINKYNISNSKYDYAFFGHSLGTNFIYEICKQLSTMNKKEPKYVFLSSGNLNQEHINSSRESIIKFLKKTEMTNIEILENDKLFNFFYPIIKNDIEIFNHYPKQTKKISIKASVLFGKDEENEMKTSKWDEYFNIENTNIYKGNHSYLFDKNNIDLIIKNIIENLTSNEYE